MTEEICGTCKHHRHIYCVFKSEDGGYYYDSGWICVNEESENAGCYTEYKDTCDAWEDKDADG